MGKLFWSSIFGWFLMINLFYWKAGISHSKTIHENQISLFSTWCRADEERVSSSRVVTYRATSKQCWIRLFHRSVCTCSIWIFRPISQSLCLWPRVGGSVQKAFMNRITHHSQPASVQFSLRIEYTSTIKYFILFGCLHSFHKPVVYNFPCSVLSVMKVSLILALQERPFFNYGSGLAIFKLE